MVSKESNHIRAVFPYFEGFSIQCNLTTGFVVIERVPEDEGQICIRVQGCSVPILF